MNWDYLTHSHWMKTFLCNNGFTQRIEKATHEGGSLLDHAYVKIMKKKCTVEVSQQAKYYSDHDALYIKITQ